MGWWCCFEEGGGLGRTIWKIGVDRVVPIIEARRFWLNETASGNARGDI